MNRRDLFGMLSAAAAVTVPVKSSSLEQSVNGYINAGDSDRVIQRLKEFVNRRTALPHISTSKSDWLGKAMKIYGSQYSKLVTDGYVSNGVLDDAAKQIAFWLDEISYCKLYLNKEHIWPEVVEGKRNLMDHINLLSLKMSHTYANDYAFVVSSEMAHVFRELPTFVPPELQRDTFYGAGKPNYIGSLESGHNIFFSSGLNLVHRFNTIWLKINNAISFNYDIVKNADTVSVLINASIVNENNISFMSVAENAVR